MAETASINFKKSTAWQIYHNDKHRPGYAIGGEVLCRPDAAEALRIKQDIVNRAIEAYTKRTGQKFQAKSYEWSAVVNLKDKPTQELYKDLRTLALHFQKKYGYQCYQIAIHKDEGHIDENGEKCLNLHAHLEFITLDKETGKNNFRGANTTKKALSQIQDEVAEILQMERGIKTLNLRADERRALKRIEPRVWAKMKEQEKGERKATQAKIKELESDVRPLKMANNILQDTISIVKEELGVNFVSKDTIKKAIEQVRVNEMKGKGFDKAAFDYLSEFKKGTLKRLELDEKITNEQFFKELDEFKRKLIELKKQKERIAELEKENEELKRELTELRKENAKLEAENQAKTAENQKLNKELDTIIEIASKSNRTLFDNVKKHDKELFSSICERIPSDKKAEIIADVERREQSSQNKATQKTQTQSQGFSIT